jgi:Transposase DDE domain
MNDAVAISRRKARSCPCRQQYGLEVNGAGRWLEEKHGARSRRGWRKLHLALNADCGEIIAQVMTDQHTGDASQVEPLLDRIDVPVGQLTADRACDGKPTYDAVIKHSADAAVVIPPRANALDRSETQIASQRDRHIAAINTNGRMNWQAATGYGKRSLVETNRPIQIHHRTPAEGDRSGLSRRKWPLPAPPSIAYLPAHARNPSAATQPLPSDPHQRSYSGRRAIHAPTPPAAANGSAQCLCDDLMAETDTDHRRDS